MWEYENESDHSFYKLFGMNRDTMDALLVDLEEVIPVGRSSHGQNMLPMEKLLTFLYCARGNLNYKKIL